MRDIVFEWCIPYVLDRKKQMIKVLLISAAIVFFIDGIFIASVMLLPSLILGVVSFFLFRSWKYEYEYVYVNGDLTITKIIRKCKRRDVYHVTRTEITAFTEIPASQIGGAARQNGSQDFTSGRPGVSVYTMKARGQTIYIEPSNEFVDEMSKYIRA